jgi:hypothetical protein
MQIDSIYSEESIHKALIVCHDDEVFDDLFKQLEADDYPICNIHEVNSFQNDAKRLLMIDYIDFNNLDKLLSQKDMYKLTTIFMIEYHNINKKPPKINNPDINFYIVQ